MITLLYGCFQVELTVRDLDAARAFMAGVLGARAIEQELAGEIESLLRGSGYRVDHLDCGQATFQVNQPAPSASREGNLSVHQANLQRLGPCVANLNFYVDDIRHARHLLTGLGCQIRTEGPSTTARSMSEYGPGNTRAGGDARPFLFVGTRQRIGLDLEIMEPNFERFADQKAQYPCFVRPPDRGGGLQEGCIRLERLRVAVGDMGATYGVLARLFAPGSLSRPYGTWSGADFESFRVWLGGIEIEYCQPLGDEGSVASFLGRYGAGVPSVEFSAPEPEAVAARAARDWSVEVRREPRPGPEGGLMWLVASRDIVGFDVGLVPWTDPFRRREGN